MNEFLQNELQLRIKVGGVSGECPGAEVEIGGRWSVVVILLETVGGVNHHPSCKQITV
jgi:hypothetical protein